MIEWYAAMHEDPEDKLRRTIEEATYVVLTTPHNGIAGIDAKLALEVGFAILLGKPIVAVSRPFDLPILGLLKVVAARVEVDKPLHIEEGKQELLRKIGELRKRGILP